MKELTPLFKMLRTEGFTARQRFMCCSGCAGSAIAEEFRLKLEKGEKVETKGFVYFHAQDVIDDNKIRYARYDKKDPSMMLRFGPVTVYGGDKGERVLGNFGLPVEEVGAAVVKALKACNIPYEWDGNPDLCIEIFPLGRAPKPEKEQRAG